MRLVLHALLLLAGYGCGLSAAQDVVWYIGGRNGSADISTCGRSIGTPCINLTVILQDSQLFENGTSSCRISNGDEDGRSSTTLYFLEGTHHMDPVCLTNWDNLSAIGLGPRGSVIVTTGIGGMSGLFSFTSCTQITISNIVFGAAFVGRSTLHFCNTRDITISDCSFSVETANTRGVEMIQCSGDIFVARSTFVGNPELASRSDNVVIGLSIVHGYEFNPLCTGDPQPMQLSISDSYFTSLTSGGGPDDNYASTRSIGTALRVRFLKDSINNQVSIDNITVTNTVSVSGSAVLVDFDTGSDTNTVSITRSKFSRNRVRYGGGVASYFFSGPQFGRLSIEDCMFEDNEAAFEGGGVFVVFLGSDASNFLQINRSVFRRNTALVGAAVFLLNNPVWFSQRGLFDPVSPPLITANISDCAFTGNRADLKEGVLNLLRMELYVGGESKFLNNSGSAVTLRLSLGYFSGRFNFTGNKADTGGALNILQGSRVDFSGVTSGVFARNTAVFAGGAIFADRASTSKLAVEYNHTFAQGLFGACFIMFGNEPIQSDPDQVPRRFTFVGNTAVSEGQSIHAYSLRGCVLSNFVPTITANYLLIKSDGTVGYDDPSILDNTSTGPSNLFFYGASTKCYKTVANTTYLLPNCSHNQLNKTFFYQPYLQCGLESLFSYDLGSLYTPGTGLRPPLDKLYTPWASIEATWTLEPGFTRSKCSETNPSNLVLSPAPGEEFDMTIQLADQLLNYVSATIFLDVLHDVDSSPGVLLQLNGIQYAYNDRVYFTPNRALSGLAIVGLPGTAGKLRVVADSQVLGETVQLVIPFQLSQCPLGYYIPPGAATLEEVNELLLTNFSVTQRIPSDQPLACQCFTLNDVVEQRYRSNFLDDTTCIQGYTVELSSLYWAGYIPMATGPSPLLFEPCSEPPIDPTPIDDRNYTIWVRESRRIDSSNGISAGFDPVDVVPYQNGATPGGDAPVICFNTRNVSELVQYKPPNGEFTADICTRGYCRGDADSAWFLSDIDYPCIDNREGVLCGQCKPGFAVTIYTTTCYDCRGLVWQGVIALFTTLIGGLVLVLLAIGFKLGLSPTIDSTLFFIQSVLILLSGRTDYSIYTYWLPFFNPDFTFNLCISPHLTAFGRLLLQYVTPVYILLLLCLILVLTKYTRLSRFLGKHSFLQGLWLLFLISYFNIGTTSFELLNCRSISSAEGGVSRYLLSHDASVECFSGSHLPAGILASVLVGLFVLPLPLYVYLGMWHSRLKPLTDIYCASYKDTRRWWVVVSIARRLLLVLVGVFVQDYTWRHFGLFLSLGLIQVFYVLTWPYKKALDNYFGFIVGWVLLFVGLISQPALYLLVDISQAISMTAVVNTVFIGLILIVLEVVLQFFDLSIEEWLISIFLSMKNSVQELRMPKMSTRDSTETELEESGQSNLSTLMPKMNTIDATTYREPLLDSFYGSQNTSMNSSSRDSRLKDSFEKTRRWRTSYKKTRQSAKLDDTLEALPGVVGVTFVTPENGVVYNESGVAATSYTAPETTIN